MNPINPTIAAPTAEDDPDDEPDELFDEFPPDELPLEEEFEPELEELELEDLLVLEELLLLEFLLPPVTVLITSLIVFPMFLMISPNIECPVGSVKLTGSFSQSLIDLGWDIFKHFFSA